MIAVMAVMCLTASAQKIRHDVGTFTLQPMVGLSVGVLGVEAEYYVNDWLSATAGVHYTQQGWRMKEKISGDKWNMNLDYINIPVMANFYVAKGFALKIGVQPGFLINAKNDGTDVKKGFESFNFSIPFGLSYEFKNGITLDWRTMIAVTTANKNSTSDDKYRSNCAWLTLGYKFSL